MRKRAFQIRLCHARAACALTAVVALAAACAADDTAGGGSGGDGDWSPSEQITMVLAFGAGGGTDVIGRAMLAAFEACESGITGNVEYHEGGSGVVGYSHFQQITGDHNIMTTTTELTTLPMFVDTSFTWESYTPIAHVADDQVALAVPGDSDFESLDDVIEEAQNRTVTVGVVGLSGPDNIARLMLESQAGVEFEPVIFDGSGETAAALLGGDVDATIGAPTPIVGHIETDDIRAVAIFGEDRYEDGPLTEVPTAQEEGYDIAFTQWRGLLATSDISDEARDWYVDCLQQWQETEEYEQYLETSLTTQAFTAYDEFEAMLAEQDEMVYEVLEASGAFDQ